MTPPQSSAASPKSWTDISRDSGSAATSWPAGLLGSGAASDQRDTRAQRRGLAPTVEVFQRGDRLIIRAELPGLSKEDIHVEVANDTITIQGERRQEHEERREDYFHSERSYGSFFRNILLPEGIEADKAEANFRDGVLEITIPAPRREKNQPTTPRGEWLISASPRGCGSDPGGIG